MKRFLLISLLSCAVVSQSSCNYLELAVQFAKNVVSGIAAPAAVGYIAKKSQLVKSNKDLARVIQGTALLAHCLTAYTTMNALNRPISPENRILWRAQYVGIAAGSLVATYLARRIASK